MKFNIMIVDDCTISG